MTTNVDSLLEEAQRAYAAGDPHRALECWHHVLDLAPGHPAATQYIDFVRRVLNLDAPTTTAAAMPSPSAGADAAPSTADATATPLQEAEGDAATPNHPQTTDSKTLVPPTEAYVAPTTSTATPTTEPASTSGGVTGALLNGPAPDGAPLPLLATLSWAGIVAGDTDAPIAYRIVPPDTASAATTTAPANGLGDLPSRTTPPAAYAPNGDDDRARAMRAAEPSAPPVSASTQPALAVEPAAPTSAGDASTHGNVRFDALEVTDAGAMHDLLPPVAPVDLALAPRAAHSPEGPPAKAITAPDAADPEGAAAPPAATSALPRVSSGSLFPAGRPEERVVRQSVRFDEPTPMASFLRTASLPGAGASAPEPLPTSTAVPRSVSASLFPAGRPEERVVRHSVRYDDPASQVSTTRPSQGTTPPAPAGTLFSGEGDASMPPPDAAAETAAPAGAPPQRSSAGSPWDVLAGPGEPIDLDQAPSPPSPLAALLTAAPRLDQARIATPPAQPLPTESAAVDDDSEPLMEGARELFDLGDYSGSLELVEKVLRRKAEHEGARAYLQRNEATLTKMYESKLGELSRAPRQLVRPDEVIWMNMHHRAGFILSLVDGSLSYDDIVDVSGLKRFEAVRILAELVNNGVIG